MNFNDQLLVDNTKITPCPSTIMISKASKSDTSLFTNNNDICRHSPSASVCSKGSVDGWNIDKDIITRTYDKYQSFSPFKTPDCNKDEVKRQTSKRQILPPSLHNLDQFLPSGEESSLRPNTSFASRSLSPSRSMFHRQQKQPPMENVPSEIKISRFRLLPAITKSQRSSTHNLHGDTGHTFPVPSCFEQEDQYDDEEVEQVLKKEDFSLDNLHDSMRSDAPSSIPGNDISVDISTCKFDSNHRFEPPVLQQSFETQNVQNYIDHIQISSSVDHNQINIADQDAHETHDDDFLADSSSSSLSPNSYGSGQGSSVARTPSVSTVICDELQDDDSISPVDGGGDVDINSVTSNAAIYPPEAAGYYEERIPSARSAESRFYNDNYPAEEDVGSANGGLSVYSPMMANSVTPSMAISPLSPNALISPGMEMNSVTPESARIGASSEVHSDVIYSNGDAGSREESVVTHTGFNSPSAPNEEDSSIEIKENKFAGDQQQQSEEPYKFNFLNGDINSDSTVKVNANRPVQIQTAPSSNNTKTSPSLKSPRKDLSPNVLSPNSLSADGGSTITLAQTGSRLFRSSTILPEDQVQSVMKDIFNSQIVEKSSLYLTPKKADDFSEGLDLKLELEEEIVRAMNGLEEFVMDNYDAEIDDDDE